MIEDVGQSGRGRVFPFPIHSTDGGRGCSETTIPFRGRFPRYRRVDETSLMIATDWLLEAGVTVNGRLSLGRG